MSLTSDILTAIGEPLVAELKAKTPSRSGRTRDSIIMEVTDISLSIYGASYIGVFETGRGPTKSSTPSSPTLQQSILQWIERASITPEERNGKTPTTEQLSWAIANHIHKNGNMLYQTLAGGKTDYFDSVFTPERVDSYLKLFADRYQTVIFSEVIDTFNKPSQ